jgi:hypothetical protein
VSPPWIGKPAESARALVRDLEIAHAQRDRALDALEHMHRIITETGGYMAHEDQARLFEARALLEEHGRGRQRNG